MADQRFTQRWDEVERLFPGSSAAFDRDLGEGWLDGRDGPRFDIYGPVLHVFAGESPELGHQGPWASAYYEPERQCWIVKRDDRNRPPPPAVTPPRAAAPAFSPASWIVRWRDGDGGHGELRLVRGQPCFVGRGLDCQISTDDPMVSRRHAKIEWTLDNALVIEDLASANGTFRLGVQIAGPTRLAHDDTVRCGGLIMRFIDEIVVVAGVARG